MCHRQANVWFHVEISTVRSVNESYTTSIVTFMFSTAASVKGRYVRVLNDIFESQKLFRRDTCSYLGIIYILY